VQLNAAPPADRNQLGQWVRGQSGNPKGKARGLKNFVTLERLALEAGLRSYLASDSNIDKLLKGFDRLFGIIEQGGDKEAIAAFKILADKLMTAPKETNEESQGPQQLTVVITQARGGDEPAMRVIDPQDAEFEEVHTEDEEA
jgi:hypothetical protein